MKELVNLKNETFLHSLYTDPYNRSKQRRLLAKIEDEIISHIIANRLEVTLESTAIPNLLAYKVEGITIATSYEGVINGSKTFSEFLRKQIIN